MHYTLQQLKDALTPYNRWFVTHWLGIRPIPDDIEQLLQLYKSILTRVGENLNSPLSIDDEEKLVSLLLSNSNDATIQAIRNEYSEGCFDFFVQLKKHHLLTAKNIALTTKNTIKHKHAAVNYLTRANIPLSQDILDAFDNPDLHLRVPSPTYQERLTQAACLLFEHNTLTLFSFEWSVKIIQDQCRKQYKSPEYHFIYRDGIRSLLAVISRTDHLVWRQACLNHPSPETMTHAFDRISHHFAVFRQHNINPDNDLLPVFSSHSRPSDLSRAIEILVPSKDCLQLDVIKKIAGANDMMGLARVYEYFLSNHVSREIFEDTLIQSSSYKWFIDLYLQLNSLELFTKANLAKTINQYQEATYAVQCLIGLNRSPEQLQGAFELIVKMEFNLESTKVLVRLIKQGIDVQILNGYTGPLSVLILAFPKADGTTQDYFDTYVKIMPHNHQARAASAYDKLIKAGCPVEQMQGMFDLLGKTDFSPTVLGLMCRLFTLKINCQGLTQYKRPLKILAETIELFKSFSQDVFDILLLVDNPQEVAQCLLKLAEPSMSLLGTETYQLFKQYPRDIPALCNILIALKKIDCLTKDMFGQLSKTLSERKSEEKLDIALSFSIFSNQKRVPLESVVSPIGGTSSLFINNL